MSAYEGGQNHLPDIPAERWRELYMEAAAELERLRADLARSEADALLRVIQRLNANPYSLTKMECIDEVQQMRAAAIAAQGAQR